MGCYFDEAVKRVDGPAESVLFAGALQASCILLRRGIVRHGFALAFFSGALITRATSSRCHCGLLLCVMRQPRGPTRSGAVVSGLDQVTICPRARLHPRAVFHRT